MSLLLQGAGSAGGPPLIDLLTLSPLLWYRAADLAQVDGTPVTGMTDKSGNGRNTDAAIALTYKTAIIGGRAVVRGTSVSSLMRCTGGGTLPRVCQVFCVAQYTSAFSAQQCMYSGSVATTNDISRSSSTGMQLNAGTAGATTPQSPHVYVATFRSAAPCDLRVDGVQVATAAAISAGADNANVRWWRDENNAQIADMDLGDALIVAGEVSAANLLSAEATLKAYYSTP